MLIGGFAVMAHGAGRFTKDIDLLVDDSPENASCSPDTQDRSPISGLRCD